MKNIQLEHVGRKPQISGEKNTHTFLDPRDTEIILKEYEVAIDTCKTG